MALRCSTCGTENADHARFCQQCGWHLEANTPDVDPLIGRVVADRYRISRKLGEGGMSQVYVAEQRLGKGSRDVAMKVVRVDLGTNPDLRERFEREVELLGQLNHPNTIRIFEHGELPDGRPFMVMEFVDGEPLSDVIAREAPLDPTRVEQIAIQIVSALHEAHELGIIHRDLKPANVLLTTAGPQRDFVRLLDFGIARRVRGHELRREITLQGVMIGTPPYMAPEQFGYGVIDARTDVYALGVMLYELYTGELPLHGHDAISWAGAHASERPRPLKDTDAGSAIPGRAAAAVMHALAKAPEDRPQTVLALLQELAGSDQVAHLAMTSSTRLELGTSRVPRAPEPSADAGDETVRLAMSGWARFGWIVVLLLLLGGLGAGAYWWMRRGDPLTPAGRAFDSVTQVRNASNAQNAIGVRDGQLAEIRTRGAITVELGGDQAYVSDGTARPDLFVVVGEGSGGFFVDVSVTGRPFIQAFDRHDQTVDIDLDSLDIASGFLVRVRSAGDAVVLLDAVEATNVMELPRPDAGPFQRRDGAAWRRDGAARMR